MCTGGRGPVSYFRKGLFLYQNIVSDTTAIMLNTKPKSRILPLNILLDGVEQANQKDSWDYTGGHLNHNHLFKPTVLEKSFWTGGKMTQTPTEKAEKVKDSFINFTLKSSSVKANPKAKSSCASSPIMKQTGPFTPINTPFANSVVDTRPQTTCQENPEHKEYTRSPLKQKELDLPEIKLLKFGGPPASLERGEQYQFLPAYFTGLTKSDQFNMFLQFGREIPQKQDISKDFHKNGSVEYHEKKLIKAAYDGYVGFLLDAQCSPQHEVLISEIAGMKKRPVKTEDVEEVMQNVRGLEDKAFIALERNDQLRNDLKTELNNSFPEMVSDITPQLPSRTSDPSGERRHISQVEELVTKRSDVLKALTEVNGLEEEIRKSLTHAVNAEATEQYISDIQKETMKLKSSNDFFQRANQDLESEIKRSLMKQKLTLDKQEEIKILLESLLKAPDL
ncbi:uncharacterized protein C6orf118 homolog isoform X4 [Dendropsophus ebraccatus]|uniref:uncharacterized protein C6orf118 homolog isoform X4 n=1 Tax=Dendropsophus ebraccatus TaxID=150705 RepID=UPI003831D133